MSSQENKLTTEQAIRGLLNSIEKQAQDKAAKQALPSEPNEPAEPNDLETETTIEELLGPPPFAPSRIVRPPGGLLFPLASHL